MAEVLQLLQGAVGVSSRPCRVDVAGDAAIVVVVEREVKLRSNVALNGANGKRWPYRGSR